MQKITPHLWFDNNAEEAVKFYTSIFKKSKILYTARYGESGAQVFGRQAGSVMTILFKIEGQEFLALNGGPIFKFNESVSFLVKCKNQKELDYYWDKLSQGGDANAQQCGWLKDKFGLSWQIVPDNMDKMLKSKNAKKTEKVMAALLQMKKLDIKALKEAGK